MGLGEHVLGVVSEIPRLGSKVYWVGAIPIAVFWSKGKLHAMKNVCPHQEGPVGEGFLDGQGENISCPWHGHSFNIQSGASLFGDGVATIYPVRVENERLIISLPE